jgi:hypothetical protein
MSYLWRQTHSSRVDLVGTRSWVHVADLALSAGAVLPTVPPMVLILALLLANVKENNAVQNLPNAHFGLDQFFRHIASDLSHVSAFALHDLVQ